jgi:hypothetical protein
MALRAAGDEMRARLISFGALADFRVERILSKSAKKYSIHDL